MTRQWLVEGFRQNFQTSHRAGREHRPFHSEQFYATSFEKVEAGDGVADSSDHTYHRCHVGAARQPARSPYHGYLVLFL
jgi:hypothetical protein